MKNLKKAGAVALAAVMAVAFAPVASLPVNAARGTSVGAGDIENGGKVSALMTSKSTSVFNLSENISAASYTIDKSCTFDLNGHTFVETVTVTDGATLTLYDSTATTADDGTRAYAENGAGTINLGEAGTEADTKDDTKAGNLVVNGATISTAVKITKGSVDIKDGKVKSVQTAAITTHDDKDKKALTKASSISIEGGQVTLATPAGTYADVLDGKEALKSINISGGVVTVPEKDSSKNAWEKAANEDGNFVNITGGVFVAENFGTYKKASGGSAEVNLPYLNVNAEKALPVAVKTGALDSVDNFYVGNAAIAAALNGGNKMTVINGDADVSGIKDETVTLVNDVTITDKSKTPKKALPTVKSAKAVSGISSMIITTESVDTEANQVRPTETKCVFGANTIKSTIEAIDTSTNLNKGARQYRAKIDIDYQDDFKGPDKDSADDDVVFDLKTRSGNFAGAGAGNGVGLTYFTSDPSAHVDEGTPVGLIDGKYYVAGDDTEYAKATKSVKVLKTLGWKAKTKDATENAEGASVFYVIHDLANQVEGPADTNIVVYDPVVRTAYLDDGTTKKNQATTRVFVYGKDADKNTDVYATDVDVAAAGTDGVDGVDVTSAVLTVQQLISGSLQLENVDAKVKVDAGTGLDWWSDDKDAAHEHDEFVYNFAKTEKANADFKNALYGYTSEEGVEHDPTINETGASGEVRVSTGISGKYEDIDAAVKIDAEFAGGEQTSNLSGDKTKRTWYVNMENKNLPKSVYRLRAKVGNNHLFTMDKDEADNAVASGDWVLESSNAFKMLPWNTDVKGAVKVLRFRNVKTNEFLFSTDPAEQAAKLADPEWAEGNVAFCGVSAETGYPVTRLFSTIGQGHLYSTAQAEVKSAVEKNFYHKDGVVFFAVETPEKEK